MLQPASVVFDYITDYRLGRHTAAFMARRVNLTTNEKTFPFVVAPSFSGFYPKVV